MRELPLSESSTDLIRDARSGAAAAMRAEDDRLLVVVGPCSIHDHAIAIEYAERLAVEVEKHKGDLQIMMRVYFEKPRTTVGWKGSINDPDLDGSCHINRGLRSARELLLELAEMGIASGTEFLDTITPQYIADVIAYGAIGARTTESQIHRQLASGLSMPVGFKNGTDGNLKIAIDAIGAAAGDHHFLSVTKQGVAAIVHTDGNADCHVILRGGSEPNYDSGSVNAAAEQLDAAGLPACVMVDCSHGNSRKDFKNQPGVAEAVAEQIAGGSKAIGGVMIESHLVEGKQSVAPVAELVHGQSITDACVGWETTEIMLATLAQAVRTRRNTQS